MQLNINCDYDNFHINCLTDIENVRFKIFDRDQDIWVSYLFYKIEFPNPRFINVFLNI